MSTIAGENRSAPYLSMSPLTSTRLHLEAHLLRDILNRQAWLDGENSWLVNMFPNSEPILLRRVAPASTDKWVLVNGRCDHTAVCVWPVTAVALSHTHEMFEPLVTNTAKVDYRCVYDRQWELLTCIWSSPAQQVEDYGAPRHLAIAPAHLRLVCLHGPESIGKAASRQAFWTTSEKDVVKFAVFDGLGHLIEPLIDFSLKLEVLVRYYHPELNDTDVYLILLKRVAEDSALEDVAEDADFQELLDRSDRAKIEDNKPKRASQAKYRKAFLKGLEPLKRKVCLEQKAEHDRMTCEARARGPTYYMHVEEEWTVALVSNWAPPFSRMLLDSFNARWRISWLFGNVSRSWNLHGYFASCIACLRIAWESHTFYTGLPCDIPGVFEDPVLDHGRGRGRGRGGRARGGLAGAAVGDADLAVGRGRGGRRGRGVARGRGVDVALAPALGALEIVAAVAPAAETDVAPLAPVAPETVAADAVAEADISSSSSSSSES